MPRPSVFPCLSSLLLESDDQIEIFAGRSAFAFGDDASRIVRLGFADTAFVRMSGKVFDCRAVRFFEKFVQFTDDFDLLIIAVCAAVIIREINCLCFLIVAFVSVIFGIILFRVKIMRRADAADRAERRSHILMIARRENSFAVLPKFCNRLAFFRVQISVRIQSKKPEFVKIGIVQIIK